MPFFGAEVKQFSQFVGLYLRFYSFFFVHFVDDYVNGFLKWDVREQAHYVERDHFIAIWWCYASQLGDEFLRAGYGVF